MNTNQDKKYAKKRLAVITGSSSGIGKAFAYQLAMRGYDLVLIARREKLLRAIATDLQKKFKISVTIYQIDLASENQREKFIKLMKKKHSSIDLLINNAGFGKFGESSVIGTQEALRMIQVNVIALTDLTLSLLPEVLKSTEKSIINIASVAAFHPSIVGGVYAATKSYVYSFSMALAAEYERKLRILTLCPGLTATGFWAAANVRSPSLFVHTSEEVVEKALRSLGKKKLLVIGFENQLRIFIQKLLSDEIVLTLTTKVQNFLKK